MIPKTELIKAIGKAILLSSITFAIASVEMSSKFSVLNFSKDDITLQRAADALKGYMVVGGIWMVGTILTLYASFGWCGAWLALAANIVMMGWIIVSYIQAFKQAAKEHHLKEPTVLSKNDWLIGIVVIIVLFVAIWYLTSS